jgi:hypothetical protein
MGLLKTDRSTEDGPRETPIDGRDDRRGEESVRAPAGPLVGVGVAGDLTCDGLWGGGRVTALPKALS